jgi:hypothetical protein
MIERPQKLTQGGLRHAGTLALLVDISTLAQLVSIGTLFVFFMVDFGVLVRRFCKPDTTGWAAFLWRALPMLLFNIGDPPTQPLLHVVT